MKLHRELANTGIVLVSINNNFDPTVVDGNWLNTNGIVPIESIDGSSRFSPEATQIISSDLRLLILPSRVQIAPGLGKKEFDSNIGSKLEMIISRFASAEVSNAGINFYWHLDGEQISSSALSKQLFYNNSLSVSDYFNEDNAACGVYLSKEIEKNVRLKLDIKPVTIRDKNSIVTGTILCLFNFHLDTTNDKNQIARFCNSFNTWRAISEEVINLIK